MSDESELTIDDIVLSCAGQRQVYTSETILWTKFERACQRHNAMALLRPVQGRPAAFEGRRQDRLCQGQGSQADMKRTWSDRVGEWMRNRLRNKSQNLKPEPEKMHLPGQRTEHDFAHPLVHRERAKLVQGCGIDPASNLPNKQYVLEHPGDSTVSNSHEGYEPIVIDGMECEIGWTNTNYTDNGG